MRKILILALALMLVAGCKKAKDAESGGGGGGVSLAPPAPGGVVQGVRLAAVRTASLAELDQLRKIIEAVYTEKGQMPTVQEINAALHPEGLKLRKQIEDKAIILTGTSKHDDVWAYSAHPVSQANQHAYASGTTVDRISRTELDQRLKQQGSPGL